MNLHDEVEKIKGEGYSEANADLTLEQEEYAFDVGFQDDAVSLLINSRHQMITEKLKSLVKIGLECQQIRC